ncbi:hypothetical protein CVT25_006555 [Psilocybe cyanescens]|uniref:Uncharacterized protein n=1 Tax=Psilocybe cyanescens TaxID=93625 RepID=A0A409XKL0_PSICY|nr:hypothetical protein CVT25_006555 [Psilocybe cyanescens]
MGSRDRHSKLIDKSHIQSKLVYDSVDQDVGEDSGESEDKNSGEGKDKDSGEGKDKDNPR